MVTTRRRPANGSVPPGSASAAASISNPNVDVAGRKLESHVSKAAPFKTLLSWDQIEHWQQDNTFILKAYRRASYSLRESVWSITYIHNESVNIHTHLWGGLFFAVLPLYLHLRTDSSSALLLESIKPHVWTHADFVAFGFFFIGSILCLLMSAAFHTLSDHSLPVATFGNKLDYVGICLMIAGSFIPCVYYGFHCDPFYQRLYWAMITLLGIACAVTSTLPKFRTPLWRPFRAAMFTGMGLSGVLPVIHGLSRWGLQEMENRIGLSWLVLQGLLYVMGAGLYAARIPEKWSPGTFDVWGSSHQIFHVFVICAAGSHLVGLMKAATYTRVYLECSA